MKAYVTGYDRRPQEELDKRLPDDMDDMNVLFHKEPKWVMQFEEEAKSECQILHRIRTHKGTHICQLCLEEQPEGGFAIVCNEHPDWE